MCWMLSRPAARAGKTRVNELLRDAVLDSVEKFKARLERANATGA